MTTNRIPRVCPDPGLQITYEPPEKVSHDQPYERELTDFELDHGGFPSTPPPTRVSRKRPRLLDRVRQRRAARLAATQLPQPKSSDEVEPSAGKDVLVDDEWPPFPDDLPEADQPYKADHPAQPTPVANAAPQGESVGSPSRPSPTIAAPVVTPSAGAPSTALGSAEKLIPAVTCAAPEVDTRPAANDPMRDRNQHVDALAGSLPIAPATASSNVQPVEVVHAVNEHQVGIDPEWLQLFLDLGRARKRRSVPLTLADGSSVPSWPTRSGLVCLATAPDGSFTPPRFGQTLSRVCFAIHLAVMFQKRVHVYLAFDWLADMVWGTGTARPRHWRGRLRSTIETLARLQLPVRSRTADGIQIECLFEQTIEDEWGWRIRVSRCYLGRLAAAVQEDGTLQIVRRHVKVDAKVTKRERQALIDTGDPRYQLYGRKELDEAVRVNRQRERETSVSCQALAKAKRYIQIPVAAFLGDPQPVRKHGPLAATLFRERSRQEGVTASKVPAWSGPTTIQCPHLNAEATYIAFAANVTRRGRGYKLATWARLYEWWAGDSVSPRQFLDIVARSVETLGLIALAIAPGDLWYTLDELRTAPANVLDRVHLRFYATQEDWVTRWCDAFGWRPLMRQTPGEKRGVRGTELEEIAPLVRERGVAAVAKALNLDPSNLSKALAGKRSLAADTTARLRAHLLGSFPSGGTGPGTIFGGCTSMLDYALAYHRLGWAVIPMMRPNGPQKRPLVSYKPYYRQRPSVDQIREWWDQWPDAGIALVLGPQSGVMAIDVDGKVAYDVLIQHLGAEPVAPRSMSGSGDPYRMHFYFRHPDLKTIAKFTPWLKQLEFRGHTGLLVLPPSPHRSGNTYAWAEGRSIEDVALPPVPDAVLKELQNRLMKPAIESRAVKNVSTPTRRRGGIVFSGLGKVAADTHAFLSGKYCHSEGERNPRLFTAACDLCGRGYAIEKVEELLLAGLEITDDEHRRECVNSIGSAYSVPRRPGR